MWRKEISTDASVEIGASKFGPAGIDFIESPSAIAQGEIPGEVSNFKARDKLTDSISSNSSWHPSSPVRILEPVTVHIGIVRGVSGSAFRLFIISFDTASESVICKRFASLPETPRVVEMLSENSNPE